MISHSSRDAVAAMPLLVASVSPVRVLVIKHYIGEVLVHAIFTIPSKFTD